MSELYNTWSIWRGPFSLLFFIFLVFLWTARKFCIFALLSIFILIPLCNVLSHLFIQLLPVGFTTGKFQNYCSELELSLIPKMGSLHQKIISGMRRKILYGEQKECNFSLFPKKGKKEIRKNEERSWRNQKKKLYRNTGNECKSQETLKFINLIFSNSGL